MVQLKANITWSSIKLIFPPFSPNIKIFNSVTNNYTNLDMKDYVKYLRLMIDSNLSWKYHTELICYKVSRSLGIIAKIQHYIPRRLLLQIYNSLIVPYLTYGICAWGNCSSNYGGKILLLQKRAFRLIYLGKSKELAVSFFLKCNCLPLPSLFFQECSYLVWINRQCAPIKIVNQFT